METFNFLEYQNKVERTLKVRYPNSFIRVTNNVLIHEDRIWIQIGISLDYSEGTLDYFAALVDGVIRVAIDMDGIETVERMTSNGG